MSYVDALASARTTSRAGEERLNQVNVLDKIASSNNGHVNHVNSGISTHNQADNLCAAHSRGHKKMPKGH